MIVESISSNIRKLSKCIEKFDKLHKCRKNVVNLLKYISFNVACGIFIDTKQFKFYDGKMVTEMHAISYFSTCTRRYLQKVTSCAFVATISYSCENPAWFITNLIVYFSCSHYLIILWAMYMLVICIVITLRRYFMIQIWIGILLYQKEYNLLLKNFIYNFILLNFFQTINNKF